MKLTKIDVAEAHLISAVRLRFRDGHPASVYLLAASAREILTTVGDKAGIRTMLHGIAEAMNKPLKEIVAAAHEYTNFLKHADRDPQAVLEGMTDADVDALLFVAASDFGRVAKGQPIETQVFKAWYLSQQWKVVLDAPLRAQPLIRASLRHFPGIRSMNRTDRLKFGWSNLQKALQDPKLKMEIQREVVLPE